jgi:hypothetical protein
MSPWNISGLRQSKKAVVSLPAKTDGSISNLVPFPSLPSSRFSSLETGYTFIIDNLRQSLEKEGRMETG